MIRPISFPARPVNGGPFPKALPKRGHWDYEPKINGWRVWVHRPTSLMFNRENEPLSIAHEFKPVLDRLKALPSDAPDWLDGEALSRRLPIGKGTLIILDTPIAGTWTERQKFLYKTLGNVMQPWAFEQFQPPANEVLSFAYTYSDHAGQVADGARVKTLPNGEQVGGPDPELFPSAAWERLQAVNKALQCELFEGLVGKRVDSPYPIQLRSPDVEFPFWMKHRWKF